MDDIIVLQTSTTLYRQAKSWGSPGGTELLALLIILISCFHTSKLNLLKYILIFNEISNELKLRALHQRQADASENAPKKRNLLRFAQICIGYSFKDEMKIKPFSKNIERLLW